MRCLFLDNFRGFDNATIPLVDVNFLVGENSTGKTSLLTVLRMFASPRLVMGPEWIQDDIQQSHFSEMVSAHSSNQTYFRLGLIDENKTSASKTPSVSGMLFTFTEKGGLPSIAQFTYSQHNREVSFKYDGENVLAKWRQVTAAGSASEMSGRIPQWIADQESGTDWTKLDLPELFRNEQVPLVMLVVFAAQLAIPHGKQPENHDFEPFMPSFGPQIVWIAPIRARPRRTYDEPYTVFSSEGSHTPYVIRRMLNTKSEADKFRDFISSVGQASGLFQKIEIKYFGDCDDPASPFEVDAYLDDKALSLGWMGYGVSQSLPIFVELLDRPKGSWFAIQQPEVHLHPRAQACLGDVFFEMAVRDKKRFVIETHSDYTIDRFRMNYRAKKSKRGPKRDRAMFPTSQILFFERRNSRNIVSPLAIGTHGEMPPDQPASYRDFFVKEEMRLLGI